MFQVGGPASSIACEWEGHIIVTLGHWSGENVFSYHLNLTEGTIYCDKLKGHLLRKLYQETSVWEMFKEHGFFILLSFTCLKSCLVQ